MVQPIPRSLSGSNHRGSSNHRTLVRGKVVGGVSHRGSTHSPIALRIEPPWFIKPPDAGQGEGRRRRESPWFNPFPDRSPDRTTVVHQTTGRWSGGIPGSSVELPKGDDQEPLNPIPRSADGSMRWTSHRSRQRNASASSARNSARSCFGHDGPLGLISPRSSGGRPGTRAGQGGGLGEARGLVNSNPSRRVGDRPGPSRKLQSPCSSEPIPGSGR